MPTTHVSVYKPIGTWQTRLIKLLPGAPIEPLRCELHVAAVTIENGLGLAGHHSAVEYEALSYSWGRPDLSAPVICNGQFILAPPSLTEGLTALRLPNAARWVWCDAICINQTDEQEKAAQVQQMVLIFAKAQRVVAWLGYSDARTDLMVRAVNDNDVHSGSPRSYIGTAEHADIAETIRRFLLRQWFSRTWVRQEVFAASELILQVGLVSMSFADFTQYARSCGVSTDQLRSLDLHHISLRPSVENEHRSSLSHRFLELLYEGVQFEVSDPRDQVYAMLGMVKRLEEFNPAVLRSAHRSYHDFVVDYRKSTSSVYQDLIKFLIQEDGNLTCLELIGTHRRSNSFPSWAIDWRDRCPLIDLWHRLDAMNTLLYSMHSIRPIGRSPTRVMNTDTGELFVQGFRIGTIRDVSLRSTATGSVNLSSPFWNHPRGDEREWEPPSITMNSLVQSGAYVMSFVGYSSADPWTENHHLSGVVVSEDTREGDIIVLLEGSRLLHVLRPATSPQKYILICSCWIWTGYDVKWNGEAGSQHPDITEMQTFFYADLLGFCRGLSFPEVIRRKSSFEERLLHLVPDKRRSLNEPESAVESRAERMEDLRRTEEQFILI